MDGVLIESTLVPQHLREEEPKKIKRKIEKCGERGSNTRPSDLQSDALPTELSPLVYSYYKFMVYYQYIAN